MAIGKASDFVVYHEQFFSGMVEQLQQNADAFNAASNNAIQLVSLSRKGDYEQSSFIELISGLVGRRNTTVTTSVTDKAMTMDEFVSVKLNRRIGPVAQARDAFRKVAQDPGTFSVLLGEQTGKAVMVDYVDTAINAVDAALSGIAGLNADVSAGTLPNGPTMTHTVLVTGLSKRGDQAQSVRAWIMHSKPYFDLMKQALADKVFEIAGVTIMQGTIATFNRPAVVIDSAQLVIAGTPTKYVTLGLVEGGGAVVESEEREIVSETVTGLENLVTRVQGEYAFNVRVKGFKWNVSGGGANPDDATLGNSSNWTQAATDTKSLAGVRILTQ